MQDQPAPREKPPPESKRRAWGNALAITLLGLLVGGLGCFVLLGSYLLRRIEAQQLTLFQAGAWWEVGFGAGMVLIVGVILAWLRARGLTPADLGWGRPTTPLALVLAVLLGAAFLGWNYMAAGRLLTSVNVTDVNWVRVALVPLGIFLGAAEETMMRGFFMTELQRARVSTWLQILASGACSASYHTLQSPTLMAALMAFVASFVLFSIHAGLYVLGKRSLTPVVLAHSIYHVFGEPYLLMLVLAVMRR